jgi:hypothetical protein
MAGFYPNKYSRTTISNGTALSPAVLAAGKLTGIQMPAAWTAADITFQGSVDGVTFYDMFDSTGTEVDLTVAASRYVAINPPIEVSPYIKVRSGTTGTPVNQAADRQVILHFRKDPIPET